MKTAGIYRPGETRGESIREYAAASWFAQTDRVEVVAYRLGMASLDAAAHLVGYDWVQAYGTDADPGRATNAGPLPGNAR